MFSYSATLTRSNLGAYFFSKSLAAKGWIVKRTQLRGRFYLVLILLACYLGGI